MPFRPPPPAPPRSAPSHARRPAWRRPAALALSLLLLAGACGRSTTRPDQASSGGVPTSLIIGIDPGSGPSTAVSAPPTSAEETSTTLPPDTTPIPSSTAATPAPTTGRPPAFNGNVYAGTTADKMSPATDGARFLVYVPHEVSGDTWIIDPTTMKVVGTFKTGVESQHVVPSYDLQTLFAISSRDNKVTPIDPKTATPGPSMAVDDPYNLYFMPDGSEAIVVAEGRQRFDFVDPKTFARHSSLQTQCPGLNHLDFAADYSYLIATCEFEGSLIKVDLSTRTVVGKITVNTGASGTTPRVGHAMPQDIRVSPDGSVFYVADLQTEGIYVIDAATFTQSGYIQTGVGAHGLYPSRDGTKLYVVNRGTPIVGGPPRGQGSVSVLDFATKKVVDNWVVPGGGSPDMGNLTADGTQLWLGGRYDSEVYVFDTVNGKFLTRIKVGDHPHGLTVWPQPGSKSLGHTGNMR